MSDDKVPPYEKFALGLFRILDRPVTYFREKVVLPNQKSSEKFYHRRFRRVPSFDECEIEDPVCMYEAEAQFRRDKIVDQRIVKILRQRRLECMMWEGPDADKKCKQVVDDYEDAATNYFIKYGDIGANKYGVEAYMKQKHRLIWERRKQQQEEGQ